MERNDRRDFLKKAAIAGASVAAIPVASACANSIQRGGNKSLLKADESITSSLIVPKKAGLQISGAFLDEISHDIPHQNWGEKEWDLDFRYMKSIGIDTVILIRSISEVYYISF